MKCSNSSLRNKRLILLIDTNDRNSPKLQKLVFHLQRRVFRDPNFCCVGRGKSNALHLWTLALEVGRVCPAVGTQVRAPACLRATLVPLVWSPADVLGWAWGQEMR